MKLSDFYRLVIKFGADRDPRKDRQKIKSYADTAVLYGDADTEIERMLIGIDIEAAELLLADRIRQEKGLDLALSHHPEGKAYAGLAGVMRVQADILKAVGVDKDTAEQLLEERMQEVERKILPQNHSRPVDIARILDLPFMCAHTPADNHAFWFIKQLMEKRKPQKLADIITILMEIPEYQEAGANCAGPKIILGSPRGPVGKILVEMTGGTEGPRDIFDKLYKAGIRTLVSMHLSEEHFKKVKDANLNVVIAGHISSDTLGLNLLLDRIEKHAKKTFRTIDCSGFHRIRRN